MKICQQLASSPPLIALKLPLIVLSLQAHDRESATRCGSVGTFKQGVKLAEPRSWVPKIIIDQHPVATLIDGRLQLVRIEVLDVLPTLRNRLRSSCLLKSLPYSCEADGHDSVPVL